MKINVVQVYLRVETLEDSKCAVDRAIGHFIRANIDEFLKATE